MKLTIAVNPAGDVWIERQLGECEVTIGRSLDCDLTIAHPQVSAQHARLSFKNGEWFLSDLFSTNGTYLRDAAIRETTAIRPGETIRFGAEGPKIRLLRFEVDETPAEFAADLPPRAVTKGGGAAAEVVVAAVAPQSGGGTPFGAATLPPPPVIVPPRSVGRETIRQRDGSRPWFSSATFHSLAFAVTLAAALFATTLYWLATIREPARGYTLNGLATGILGTSFLLSVAGYALRKRWGQEILPGRLQTWLWVHLWLSILSIWLVALHAGFHVDGGAGTWTFVLLVLTFLTGLAGWCVYAQAPPLVHGSVENLATVHTEELIEKLTHEMEDSVAGRSHALAQFTVQLLRGRRPAPASFDQAEQGVADEMTRLGQRRLELQRRLRRQRRWHFVLRSWLYLHVPVACAFVVLVGYHAYDALEVEWVVRDAGPRDYASAESCAKCHQAQYDEWIGSMHAIAQSSPVTDLQNRLVLAKERRDLASGRLAKPLVGDLCVRCHAPTGSLGNPADHESPLALIGERAPASQFGVSCVTCHQISEIHRGDKALDQGLEYKNAENLRWTQGKLMLGQIGGPTDAVASIGNSVHRGEFRDFFGDSSFCASCHTVAVDPPVGERVQLQNTYNEWLDGGNGKRRVSNVNWSESKVACLDCHGRDLGPLVAFARDLQTRRVPLAERREKMFERVLSEIKLPPLEPLAAQPADGFDRTLPPRRRFLHTFTGVDYHLEPSLPYPAEHPRAADNPRIQEQTAGRTAQLLSIAAALHIKDTDPANINVEVLNLSTGHQLPAGFAFARETWIEVAVSDRGEPRSDADWRVLIGGDPTPSGRGAPLPAHVSLDKKQVGLRNFQKVLFSETTGREVVLQNETTKVLEGAEARRFGFLDRQDSLLPGEIRTIGVTMPTDWIGTPERPTRALRVRMLMRNLPPEFLEGLALKFEQEEQDVANARRARELVRHLRIFEMARDEVSLNVKF